MRTARLLTLAAAYTLFLPFASAQEVQDDGRARAYEVASRFLRIAHSIHTAANKADGALPGDLAATVWAGEDAAENETTADRIRNFYILPGDEKSVPDDADVSWVNTHSPFVYALPADLTLKDLPGWDRVIVVHLRPDLAIAVEATDTNPDGRLIPAGTLSGMGMSLTPRAFEQRLAMSQQIIRAARDNTDFPDAVQIELDCGHILQAIRAYAAAHGDRLPPDLGSVLSYLPPDDRRRPTPRDRARVFLTPDAARNTFIPENPDADWINRNTSYVYLANDAAKLSELDENTLPLFHLRLDFSFEDIWYDRPVALSILQTVQNGKEIAPRDYVEAVSRESRELFEAIKARRELPDRYHALRDLRYLRDAIHAYSKDHDRKLPAELADTLPYLPDDEFTRVPGNRAAIYLSPRAQRSRGQLPESIAGAWVRENASYIYLGIGGLTPGEFSRRGGNQALAHGPYTETYQDRGPYMTSEHVPVLSPHGTLWLCSPEVIDGQKAHVAAWREEKPQRPPN
jgi:hypothetical protein